MKKLFSLLLVLFAFILTAQAVPPLHRPYTLQQSDGTTVTVYKNGHDGLAFYTTEDDHVVLPNAKGDLCYAVMQAGRLVASDMIAHDAVQRTAEERAFIAAHPVAPETRSATIRATRRGNRVIAASTGNGLGRYGTPGMGAVNSIGEYTIPVIMVQFHDKKFKNTTTVEKMRRFYNDEGYSEESGSVGSVRDYFRDQSRGMFSPSFDVVGIVTLDGDVADYGGNDAYGYDSNLDGMLDAAVAKAVDVLGVDFSQYVVTTTNGQGRSSTGVPLVCLFYAGYGEATGAPDGTAADTPWPCEWDCNKTIKGTHFNSVFVGNELDSGGSLMGMGVFVHETGHALGLPDFYCTDGNYRGDDACSNWSIMDTGPYVNNARAPIGYNAYEKSYLGWLDIPEISDPSNINLGSYDTEGDTLAVLVRNSTMECFILENRQPGKWYPQSMGSGILLMRLAYNGSAWSENRVNNDQNAQRLKVITASGAKMSYNGVPSHLYGNAKKEITSLPLLSGKDLTTAPVTDIKKTDGHVTFAFKGGIPEDDEPDPAAGEGKETFDFTKDEAYGMTLLSGNTTAYEAPGVVCEEGAVTLTFSDGEKDLRWWAATDGNHLRMYDSASATFRVPDTLAIVKIVAYGASRSKYTFTSEPEGITVNDVIATWEGKSHKVTVSHAGSGNAQIKSFVVRTVRVDAPLNPAMPVISPDAGEYEERVQVSISAAQDATIVYTIDGSEPRSGADGSQVYAAPFELTASATVKAVAYDVNGNKSEVAAAAYTIVPSAPAFVVTFMGDTVRTGDTIAVKVLHDAGIEGFLATTNPTQGDGLFVHNATDAGISLTYEAVVDEETVTGNYGFTVAGQAADEDGSVVVADVPLGAKGDTPLPCAVDFLSAGNYGEVYAIVSVGDGRHDTMFCILFTNADERNPLDINLDGAVDVSDVTAVVGAVLGGENEPGMDLNGDGTVDVSDVTFLVGYILGQE